MQERIVARLTAPVIAVSAVLLSVALGTAWYARDSQRSVSMILDNHVSSVRAAQELEIDLREIHVQFDRYLITGERKHLESVPGLRERAAVALQVAERFSTTESEQALMGRVRKGYEHFFAEYDRLEQSPPLQGVYAKVLELIDTVLSREILEPAREYLRTNEGMLTDANKTNRELSRRLTIGLMGLGVCGSVGGLLAGWVIAVSFRRSLLYTDRILRDTAARLGEAAHLAAAFPQPRSSHNTLQQVTAAASAVLERLKQTERDALRAEQLAWVGQLAAGIAHEVRSPLTVIKLLVQAATDPRRKAGFRPRDLEVLEGEILRLEHIISTFLDFARPPRPAKKMVEPRALIDECLAGIEARAELQKVHIHKEVMADMPPLDADPGQIKQIIYNLLFNALDVLTAGGTIRVSVRAIQGPRREIEIVVSDDGPGLPAGLEMRIFDPFVSTKETGLGLGLSISKRIAEAHGGSISAANGTGRGAVFTVRLPCATQARPTLACQGGTSCPGS
jgi:signal transduction histidine kinase/CHASE3 domain sensor protein